MQLKNFLYVSVGIPMDGTLIKKTVLNYLFQCTNHFSYAFKKRSGSNSKYTCRVSLKNYKHFFKKANNEIHCKRGLYIGFHNSCQASLENNTYRVYYFFAYL